MSDARPQWLFSGPVDLLVFLGVSLGSLAVAQWVPAAAGGETPAWAWLVFVVGLDVAHVWSTLFRVYLDGEEVRRRPVLSIAAPVVALTLSILAYSVSAEFFWRVLAYVAVWHFVRQQTGFMALYGRRAGSSTAQLRFDALAMYAATVGPVLWWHANLPRSFWWFRENDFVSGVPAWVGTAAMALDGLIALLWLARELTAGRRWGALALFLATQLTWCGGIVLARSDFAFTVMNVVLHGVPYLTLSYRYSRGRLADGGYGALTALIRVGLPVFVTLLLALAWLEEFAWDRLVWHDHPMFFGDGSLQLSDAVLMLVVPLLSLPQTTHYLLDGFVWKGRTNPFLARRLGWLT